MNKQKVVIIIRYNIRMTAMVIFIWSLFAPLKATIIGDLDPKVIGLLMIIGGLINELLPFLRRLTDFKKAVRMLITYDLIFMVSYHPINRDGFLVHRIHI